MNLWRLVKRVLLPEPPTLPEPFNERVLGYVSERQRAETQRAEREALEQEERLRQVELRLRLFERSLPAGDGERASEP